MCRIFNEFKMPVLKKQELHTYVPSLAMVKEKNINKRSSRSCTSQMVGQSEMIRAAVEPIVFI